MNKAVESNNLFVFQRSKALQQYCGDVYYTHEDENGFLYVLSDGLGSGLEANRAAKATVDAIKEDIHADYRYARKSEPGCFRTSRCCDSYY